MDYGVYSQVIQWYNVTTIYSKWERHTDRSQSALTPCLQIVASLRISSIQSLMADTLTKPVLSPHWFSPAGLKAFAGVNPFPVADSTTPIRTCWLLLGALNVNGPPLSPCNFMAPQFWLILFYFNKALAGAFCFVESTYALSHFKNLYITSDIGC